MAEQQNPDSKALLQWRRAQNARAYRRRVGWLRSFARSNRLLPRKLEITRDGKWMIAIALLLGVGAVNTGNNLLYLVLSLLISVITISGFLSEWTLKSVTLRRAYPRELVAGEATLLRVEVNNAKRAGAFNIEVCELLDSTEMLMRPGYVLHLRGDETGQCFQVARPLRRGPLRSGGIRISTRYPFGFARKSRVFDEPVRWLALPEIAEVDLSAVGQGGKGQETQSRKVGHGGEFRGLREAREGDSLRDIHWKVSARRQRLIAREWEAEATHIITLVFMHIAPDELHDHRLDPYLDPSVLDGACSTVAGIAHKLLRDGLSVGLMTMQGRVGASADPDGNGGQLMRIRRLLATLTCADRKPPANWPVPDDDWLQRCRNAEAARETLQRSGQLVFGSDRSAVGERWWVRYAARQDAQPSGGAAAVDILLTSRGEIERIEVPDVDAKGAA